jgi:hypothetical protein
MTSAVHMYKQDLLRARVVEWASGSLYPALYTQAQGSVTSSWSCVSQQPANRLGIVQMLPDLIGHRVTTAGTGVTSLHSGSH